jgi:hypothetical protein
MTARILVIARNDNMPRLSGPAPSFDATAEQWITPPSGMKPDAGAAPELRQHSEHALSFRPLKSYRPVAVPPHATGRLQTLKECLTVAFGLTVFGLAALALLVLA